MSAQDLFFRIIDDHVVTFAQNEEEIRITVESYRVAAEFVALVITSRIPLVARRLARDDGKDWDLLSMEAKGRYMSTATGLVGALLEDEA